MNRIAMLLVSILTLPPALGFADVSGPAKPGARASYQPPRPAQIAALTFHPSWQKPVLWAQARARPAASFPSEVTAARSWRDTGAKPVLWRRPTPADTRVRPALACAKKCPCHEHVACVPPCGCTHG
jgi:hypothetical protein